MGFYDFEDGFNPLTLAVVLAVNWPWRVFAFVSPLTKIILCSQVLHKEKIFCLISRSEWSGQLTLKYAQKCSESWSKISLHLALHVKNFLSHWMTKTFFLCHKAPGVIGLRCFTTLTDQYYRPSDRVKKMENYAILCGRKWRLWGKDTRLGGNF